MTIFKETLTDKRVIDEFVNVIIPGIFKATMNELIELYGFNAIIKISGVFANYVEDLEKENIIDKVQAQSLDLLWVEKIKKYEV